jgi:hypothetical protein
MYLGKYSVGCWNSHVFVFSFSSLSYEEGKIYGIIMFFVSRLPPPNNF